MARAPLAGGLCAPGGENVSNYPRSQPPQEILSLTLRLLQNFRLPSIFQRHFLQHQLHGVLRLETLRNQLPNPRRKSVVHRRRQTRQMITAFMFAKFRRSQPIVCGLGIHVGQQCRKRIIPLALRARPSLKRAMRCPDQFSGGFFLKRSTIRTAMFHERHDSRTKQLPWPMFLCSHGTAPAQVLQRIKPGS